VQKIQSITHNIMWKLILLKAGHNKCTMKYVGSTRLISGRLRL